MRLSLLLSLALFLSSDFLACMASINDGFVLGMKEPPSPWRSSNQYDVLILQRVGFGVPGVHNIDKNLYAYQGECDKPRNSPNNLPNIVIDGKLQIARLTKGGRRKRANYYFYHSNATVSDTPESRNQDKYTFCKYCLDGTKYDGHWYKYKVDDLKKAKRINKLEDCEWIIHPKPKKH